MIDITVGADPEVFLMKNGGIIPACGLIGGTKKYPLRITGNTFVQEDNVTVEFNCEPVKYEHPDSLWDSATRSYNDVREFLKSKDKDYTTHLTSSHSFAKLDDPSAWIFGCDPDLNAYDYGSQNPVPHVEHNTRFAGGHIHFGYDKSATKIPESGLVVLCDLSMIRNRLLKPSDGTRIHWYGQAGRYRNKPYGFEYRTPSCKWLGPANKKVPADLCKMVHWALNNPEKALELHNEFIKLIGVSDYNREYMPKHIVSYMTMGKEGAFFTKLDEIYDKYVGL